MNLGRSRAYLVAIRQAIYKPVMEVPYNKAVKWAVAMIPDIMAAELVDADGHMASHSRRL